MIIDSLNEYSDAQAVTASAASTDVVDHGAAGETIGEELYFTVVVPTGVTAAGAATVNIALQTATDEAFTSPKVLYSSGAIAKDDLGAGTTAVRVRVPKGRLRYTRTYYTVATGPLTAGAFDAFLTEGVQDQSVVEA